jgi:hypothetical protein
MPFCLRVVLDDPRLITVSGSSSNPSEISEKISVLLTCWQAKLCASKALAAAIKQTES